MSNFVELYKKFLDNTITDAEKSELAELFITGKYDDVVRQMVKETSLDKMEDKNLKDSEDDEILKAILPKEREVIPFYRRRVFQIAASFTILVACLLWFDAERITNFLGSRKVVGVSELSSAKEKIALPDGSTVFLNIGSSVTYGEDFGSDNREVELVGEGFFDVKHDPTKPFKVRSSGVIVTVLGTAFNVNAYPVRKEVTVTVTRGLVEVSNGKNVYGKIHPDQELIVKVPTLQYELKTVKAEETIKWKRNFLLLDDVKLSQAAKLISDRYKVKIIFTNPALAECRIQGAFLNDESLTHILTSICTVLHWDYRFKDSSTVIIEGQSCY